MPKKTASQNGEKSRAKNIKKAKRYVAKGKRIGERSSGKTYSPKRRVQIKGMAQATTADSLISAGKKVIAAKGQGALPKKKTLKVTARSIKKADETRDQRLKSQRKGAGRATTTRPKRKK